MDAAAEARPAPVPQEGLAATYAWDMGQRTEDLALWAAWLAEEAARLRRPLTVVEVGGGTARVPRGVALGAPGLLIARWVGLDPDPAMIAAWRRRAPAWACAVQGDAANPAAWAEVRRAAGGLADVVLAPYATLFLLPHAAQGPALALGAAALAPRGALWAEVYEPAWTETGTRQRTVACRPEEPDPAGRAFVRQTTYQVDGPARLTVAERVYGPQDPTADRPRLWAGRALCRVTERIHWRPAAEWPGLAREAGLPTAGLLGPADDPLIPAGSRLLVARR